MALESVMADAPGGAIVHAVEILGRIVRRCSGKMERDTGGRHADRSNPRTGVSIVQNQAQETVGRFERVERRCLREALQQRRSVQGPFRRRRDRIFAESVARSASPSGPSGQGRTGDGAEAEGNQLGQMSRWLGVRRCAARAHVSGVAGVACVRRQAQAPSLPELVRVHEA